MLNTKLDHISIVFEAEVLGSEVLKYSIASDYNKYSRYSNALKYLKSGTRV